MEKLDAARTGAQLMAETNVARPEEVAELRSEAADAINQRIWEAYMRGHSDGVAEAARQGPDALEILPEASITRNPERLDDLLLSGDAAKDESSEP